MDPYAYKKRKSYFESVDFKIGSKHCDKQTGRLARGNIYHGPPMIDVKAAKQETLKGDKDVIYYVEGDSPNVTSYAKNLRGL